jgi:hypothetical protein
MFGGRFGTAVLARFAASTRPFESVTERRCLALLDAFKDDLVRLHDVVDV